MKQKHRQTDVAILPNSRKISTGKNIYIPEILHRTREGRNITPETPRHVSAGEGQHDGSHEVIAVISRLSGLQKLDFDFPAEPRKGDVILLETPVNPRGGAYNIEKYSKVAYQRGAYLIVDSTFVPPG
ncbi:hypothetical protein PABG_04387 [Paracoccidioides brasiliensis Pb03]|nr:hypothetical protein PABG_04387 [Paracoccidioides brasiliensis Pb03]